MLLVIGNLTVFVIVNHVALVVQHRESEFIRLLGSVHAVIGNLAVFLIVDPVTVCVGYKHIVVGRKKNLTEADIIPVIIVILDRPVDFFPFFAVQIGLQIFDPRLQQIVFPQLIIVNAQFCQFSVQYGL